MFGRNITLKTAIILFAIISICAFDKSFAQDTSENSIAVTANFAEREIATNERIELNLNRSLTAQDGRLAVFVGNTDISSLFSFEG
jgi:hypothetical protein